MTQAERAAAPTLSIITVSWNHRDEIAEYLRHVEAARAKCKFPIEMVLVDNASADATAELVKRDFPWVTLIENEKNEGFAVGCNIGLERAASDYLFLLNPDAYADAPALEAMIEYLQSHRDVGAVGCTLLHEDGQPQISAYPEMGPLSYAMNQSMFYPIREKLRKFFMRIGFRHRHPYECGWLQGSCILVPRAVYEKVGGLEASYFMYCEDTDWSQRIWKAGFKNVELPNVSMLHRQKGSSRRAPEYTFRRVYRSVVLYANIHITGARRDMMDRVMLADMRLRIPVYTLVGILKPSRKPAIKDRIASVRQLIKIIKARDPDLFEDPPPG
ncbi:hypothetical protein BH09SUM1_BH09SUM1_25300 [soil metagenome]